MSANGHYFLVNVRIHDLALSVAHGDAEATRSVKYFVVRATSYLLSRSHGALKQAQTAVITFLFHGLQLFNIIVHDRKEESIPQNIILFNRTAAADNHESLLDWDPNMSQIIIRNL